MNDNNKNTQQVNQGYKINFDLINGDKSQSRKNKDAMQRVIEDLEFDKPRFFAPRVDSKQSNKKAKKNRK